MSTCLVLHCKLSFNYYMGIPKPIEGSIVNTFSKESCILTFDNTCYKRTKRDKLDNLYENEQYNGLPENFNGHITMNYFNACLYKMYTNIVTKCGSEIPMNLAVACNSELEKEFLKGANVPLICISSLIESIGEDRIVETYPPKRFDDQHEFEHIEGKLDKCCRSKALAVSEYLMINDKVFLYS